MARNYTNTASQAATSAFIDATATSFALTGYTGFPAAPFTAALARGTAEEEVVLVTSVSGSTVTVTRGYDATNAVSHSAATTFQHVVVAKDYADSAAHQGAATGVHGIAGAVVGTTDAQTLTNKTLTAPAISAPTFTGAATGVDLALSGTLSAAATTLASLAVTGVLSANGGITVPAGKKATLTDAPAVGTDAVNKTYADAGVATAKSYADGLDATRKTYVDNADGALSGRITTLEAAPKYRGAGTAPPATGLLKDDSYWHDSLGLLVYNGTAWRQVEVAVAADAAARTAMSTNYAALLYSGFLVRQSDTGAVWQWNGTTWARETAGGTVLSTATNASGDIAVTHGLGVAPNWVTVTMSGVGSDAQFGKPIIASWSATTFTVRIVDTRNGSSLTGFTSNFCWQAGIR